MLIAARSSNERAPRLRAISIACCMHCAAASGAPPCDGRPWRLVRAAGPLPLPVGAASNSPFRRHSSAAHRRYELAN